MDRLVARALSGEATDIELQRLQRWRSEDAANEVDYVAAKSLWALTDGIVAPPTRPAPETQTLLREGERRRQRQALGRRGLRLAKRGLSVAGVTAAAFTIWWLGASRPPPGPALRPIESSTANTGVVTMSLSDGSVLRVAPEGRVGFTDDGDRRGVSLEGKAFFAVEKGDLPFVVRTPEAEITVTGTRFEVVSVDDSLRVTVLEGTVQVDYGEGSTEVVAGDVARFAPGMLPRVERTEDLALLFDWADGLLVFQATPLGVVAAEIGVRFDRRVSIADPSMEALRITAWFEDESLDEVVGAVCTIVGASCRIESDSLIVIGRE